MTEIDAEFSRRLAASMGPLKSHAAIAPMRNAAGREKRPHIHKGCDQQGRIPEAAHAASEIQGDDPRARQLDDLNAGVWRWGFGAAALCWLAFELLF